jgi:isopenicillin-N epimerase
MNRREVFQVAAAAATLGIPLKGATLDAPRLPGEALFQRDPETWWNKVRDEQFLLPSWRSFLQNGSLGVAPKPVLAAVVDYLTRSAALDLTEYPRWGYETLDEHRQEVSAFLGCHKDELAFTHNATEAMSMIAGGLDLGPGEEVLITDQEHVSGRGCWYLKQARYGIRVREVPIPLPPKSPGDIADRITSAIGPRTRVLSFSGITSPTGLVLPVRDICRAARAKGVLTVVDGAHMQGHVPLNLHELGCDFLAGSPHKWMFTPAGCGILYIREEMLGHLWSTIISGEWSNRSLKAARFIMVGTNNRAIIEGLVAGLRFLKQLGPERVWARIHQLGRRAFQQARELPGVRMLTPEDDRMYAGMVSFELKSPAWPAILKTLEAKRVWHFAGERTRVSTHIHTRPRDIDEFFEIVRAGLKRPA